MFHKVLPILISGLLMGCVAQPKKVQLPSINPDAGFSVSTQNTVRVSTPWWQTALDPSTHEQVQYLLKHNLDIQLAAARVKQVSANLDQAEADRWLEASGSARGSANRTDSNDSGNLSLGVNASLPLDIFGRLAKNRDAAHYDLAQSLAELEDERLKTVQKYLLTLIDGSESLQLQTLLKKQIETAKTLSGLTELRFAQGLTSSVDVLQQREQLASLKQQLPGVALQLRTLSNLLSELQGDTPTGVINLPLSFPRIKDEYAHGSPQQLLDQRPDLIALRAALAAADQRYEVALREKLPSISLSSSALLQLASGNPSAIFSAAINASLTLFDSGALNAAVAEKNAALEQSGIEYLQAWLSAVREADDLLNAQQTNRQQITSSIDLSLIAEKLFDAAQHRYKRGVSDYLPVLAALRSLQQQQRDHVALQAEQQRIRVKLHTAMGLPVANKNTPGNKP